MITDINNNSSLDVDPQESTFSQVYRLGRLIGRGGYGDVYGGTRISDNIPVAVKRLWSKEVPHFVKFGATQLPLEIVVMQQIKHLSGCVKLLDFYECDNSFVIVMEKPSVCVDLFDLISENNALTEQQTKLYFRQIIETLIEMKNIGINHGDIKDENIIVDLTTNKVKLIDFGASTFVRNDATTDFRGTAVYAPPEWFVHKCYNCLKAAVWSLGILLYNMLCGDVPYETAEKIIEAKINISHIKCSAECKHLIQKCLSYDPNKRPSFEEIRNHQWLANSETFKIKNNF